MPLEEYAANPLVRKHELLRYIVDICYAKMEKDYSGFSPLPVASAPSDKKSFFYLNHRDLNKAL
ncbi:hypothetical protein SLEP1_g29141 [Rubroshorea leprosula]|nr:hypothetical protein SLEP1_g29141 [Rubroshorea leprosula]